MGFFSKTWENGPIVTSTNGHKVNSSCKNNRFIASVACSQRAKGGRGYFSILLFTVLMVLEVTRTGNKDVTRASH